MSHLQGFWPTQACTIPGVVESGRQLLLVAVAAVKGRGSCGGQGQPMKMEGGGAVLTLAAGAWHREKDGGEEVAFLCDRIII
jgi:hypothetical protein